MSSMSARPARKVRSQSIAASLAYESPFTIEQLESRTMLSVSPAYTGALTGKVLFTSGGHGYVWRDSSKSWGIMRTYINGMMEDLGNQDQLQSYADYAIRAGATFVSMRPIGHQTNEVIVDNSQAYAAASGGFDKSGTWSDVTTGTYWSENDGNDAVRYHFANTTTGAESSVARFTPKIPSAGFYPVYTWYVAGNNRSDDTIYRVNYSGGSQEVKIQQDKVGNGWVYLGTYYFGAGVSQTAGSVQITNKSAATGKIVIADAVRFGNGMGDITQSYTYPSGTGAAYVTKVYKNSSNVITPSGRPREDEAALYWCYGMLGYKDPGVINDPYRVYGGNTSDDETKNFSACDHYAAYMNNSGAGADTDRVWISFHTNAGGGRGTKGLITNTGGTTNQTALATLAGNTVESEMIALNSEHEFAWANVSPTFTGGYSEIDDGTLGGEMDATIIEVAFHDDASDAALLKDPKVRSEVGRATYHTAIKYFDQFDAGFTNITYLPEPVRNLRVTTSAANSNLTVSWQAPLSSSGTNGPYGNAATGYKIWTSTNGYGFDLAGTTTSTSFTLTGNLSDVTYVRITSTNAGGESMPSIVAGAKPQLGRRAPILIVNNFSRLDQSSDQIESHYFGTAARVRPSYNNSFDYVVQAADAVTAYNSSLGVEYCTDAAIAGGQIALSNYAFVIWMSGEQSAGDGTFTATTQPLVTSYLNGGGKMFVSGSEIAWDLVAVGNGSSFFSSTLHATYPADAGSSPTTYNASDDAGVHATAAGIAGTALAGVPALSFDNGTHGTYDVDFPDQLGADSGATVAMNYSTGSGHGAVIQYASGNSKLVYMGFPFESIYTASQRNSLMKAVLNYFGANISLGTAAPDLLAVSDTGALSTDNVTKQNNSAGKTLQFNLANTINGATINLYSDGTFIGSGTTTGGTVTITTNGAAALVDGTHQLTARQVESGLNESSDSTPLAVLIDTTAPTLSNSAFNFQTTQSLAFTFNENLGSAVPTSGLTLHNNTTSADLSSANFAANTAGGVVTFTFPGYGNSLPNGNYTATLAAANVGDVAGNALASSGTSDFYFMNADGDRSGKVAIEDFNILAANFGKSGQTFGQGNYDYSSDGTITINDFNLLATYFGQSVDVNAPAAPASFIATNNPPASTTPRSNQTIGLATNTKPTSLDPNDKNDLLNDVLL